MPPETGLLIGRLLFFVFGVAKGGKIDIEQLTSSYEGSFAAFAQRRRREGSDADWRVSNDYVLILAAANRTSAWCMRTSLSRQMRGGCGYGDSAVDQGCQSSREVTASTGQFYPHALACDPSRPSSPSAPGRPETPRS